MIRAFVAIDLPEDIRSALTLEQFLLPMPRRIEPENLHLTLVFLGEVSAEVLEAAHEGFAGIAVPPFRITIAGLGLFGGSRPRVVWAGVEAGDELARFQSKIDRAARVAGAEPDGRRFLPHVTLGRFTPPGPEERMRLERTVAERGAFRAGAFEVESFALYRSHPGGKGARYEELARYPLRR